MPHYPIVFRRDGSFRWPRSWDLERKIQELDLCRRDYHTDTAAAPLDKATRQARWIAAKIAGEIGEQEMLRLTQAKKQENDKHVVDLEGDENTFKIMLPCDDDDIRPLWARMAVTRRMTDPPLPAPIFHKDGTVEWPSNWDLDRKIQDLDYGRRSGTPGLEALPIEEGSYSYLILQDLKKFHDPELVESKIKEIKAKNDQRWGSKKRRPPRTIADIASANSGGPFWVTSKD